MDPMDIDSISGSYIGRLPSTAPATAVQQVQPNIYQPLPTHPPTRFIRLISIALPVPSPSSPSFLLTARLEIYALDSAPPYNAISYVWGNPNPVAGNHHGFQHAIICNDTLFPVTPNLHWALHRAAIASAKLASLSSPSSADQTLPSSMSKSPGPNLDTISTTPQPNSNNNSVSHQKKKKIYLWADAICINQSDLTERSSQVSFMGSIYAQAQRVLVCMGDPPPDTSAGSNLVLSRLINTLAPYIHANGGPQVAQIPDDILQNIPAEAWHSLSGIMKRPWFRRVWVMQEVGMAREQPVVLYGFPSSTGVPGGDSTSEFGYRDLMAVIAWTKKRHELVVQYGITSLRIHAEWADSWSGPQNTPLSTAHDTSRDNKMTFYDLLDHACLLSCQDPRDRIYAFLGHPLSPKQADGFTPKIKPDYTKPVNELYLEVAKVCLEEIVGLRALVTVEHTTESLNDGYPSWMTRWHVTEIWNNISHLPEQVFSAGGWDEPGYRPTTIQGRNLMLEGVIVDRLWKLFPVYEFTDTYESTLCFGGIDDGQSRADLGELLSFLTSENVPSVYGNDTNTRLAAFAITVCAAATTPNTPVFYGEYQHNHNQGGRNLDLREEIYLDRLSKLLSIDQFLRTHPREQFNPSSAEAITGLAFWRELSGSCAGRSFAITEQGRYCLVPKVATQGDQICVVRRLDVPLLMRVDGDATTERRVLLGEAYVYGLMHGEVMDTVKRGLVAGEVFVVS